MKRIKDVLTHIYDFILPVAPECPFCGESKQSEKDVCEQCQQERLKLQIEKQREDVFACYYYDGIIRNFVLNYKYHRCEYLCETVAEEIMKMMKDNGIEADYITYIPLHRSKRRKRGFDQVKSIAQSLEALTDIPSIKTLVRTKKTQTQAKLSPDMRKQNVKNAFKAMINVKNLKDSVIILLDDVYTTGATMESAKRTLENVSIKQVIPITFAVTTFGSDV